MDVIVPPTVSTRPTQPDSWQSRDYDFGRKRKLDLFGRTSPSHERS
jgi:hypothetical protein